MRLAKEGWSLEEIAKKIGYADRSGNSSSRNTTACARTLAVVHASGVTMDEAETLRFKGELLIAKDTTNSAPAEGILP